MARIKKIATELQVKDKLLDYSGDAGTSGQLLSSTGTGTNWITFSGVTASNGSSGRAAFFTGSTTIEGSDNFYWDNSNASLGIGTTSPSADLEIDGGSNNAFIQFTTPNTNYAGIRFGDPQTSTAGRIQYYHGDNSLQFDTSGRFTFEGGNVGIGTTSPSAPLTFGKSVYGAFDSEDFYRIKFQDQGGIHNDVGIGQTASGSMGFNITAGNSFIFNNGTSGEIARFNGTGLGIGTNNPGAKLQVNGSTSDTSANAFIARNSSSTSLFSIRNDGRVDVASGAIVHSGGGYANTSTNDSYFTGKLGIGTTSPSYKLDAAGEIKSDGYRIDLSATTQRAITSTGTDSIQFGDAGVNEFKFKNAAGTSMIINSSGDVGIGTTSPNEKLHVDGTSRFNGDIHVGSTASGFTYRPVESGSALDRYFLMFDETNNASYPFLTNRTANGAVVIKTGTAAGGGENEHFRIEGGDGTVDAYFTNVNLGIGTSSPAFKLDVFDTAINVVRVGSDDNARIIINSNANASATKEASQLSFADSGSTKWTLYKETNNDFYLYNAAANKYPIHAKAGGDIVLMEDGNNLGVGASSPAQKLHVKFVNTDTAFSGGGSGAWGSEGIRIENTSGTANTMAMLHFRNSDADIHIAGIRRGTDDSDLGFFFEGTQKVLFENDGSATFSGDITVSGDLNITGDINTQTVNNLDVVDKLITLGKGQTEANSNGSGILVDGSNASLLWDETNNTWDFNKSLDIVGNMHASGNITVGGTVDGVDIAARDAVLTTTTNTANAAAPKASPTFTGDITIPNKIIHTGDTNTYMQFEAADVWRVVTGGTERLDINTNRILVGDDMNMNYDNISTGNSGTVVYGGFLNPASEANMVHIPHIINDLAGFNKWSNATITTSGFYGTRSGSSGSYTYSNEITNDNSGWANAFDSHSSTAGSWYSDNGSDGIYQHGTDTPGVVELAWTNEATYSLWVGIVFGSGSFTATYVKIEAYRGGAWQTLCEITDNTDQVVLRQVGSNSGTGAATTKLRYTLGGSVNNSYFRIHSLYMANYRAGDNNLNNTGTDTTRGVNFLERYKDGYLHGHLRPGKDDTYDFGSSSYKWKNAYFDGVVTSDRVQSEGVFPQHFMIDTPNGGGASRTMQLGMSGSSLYFKKSDTTGDVVFRNSNNTNLMTIGLADTGQVTVLNELEAGSLDINGNADISGTLTSGKHVINTGSDDILTLNQTTTVNKWNYINFNNQGTREWFIGQDSDGNFDLYNDNIDAYAITVSLNDNSILLNDNVTVAGRVSNTYTGTSAHTLQNATSNGTILTLTSTGDSRSLTLQSDHVFSNGNFYLGSNSYATYFRGSSYNFSTGNATFAGKIYGVDGGAGTPSYSFTGFTDDGMYREVYDTNKSQISFATEGTRRARFNEAGIFSEVNVYAVGDFRSFSNPWHGTQGTSGAGFRFENTADSNILLDIDGSGNGTFAGSLDVNGTASDIAFVGGSMDFNDTNNYIRITKSSASAQLGLFRSGNNVGGMYIGGASDGFRIFTEGFSSKFHLDQSGNATFAGSVHLDSDSAQLQLGDDNDMQIFHNGANGEINIGTGSFTIDSAGDITLDAGGNDIFLFNAGTEYGHFKQYNQGVGLYVSIQDKDFVVRGNDGGTTITAFGLDMSEGGKATFSSTVRTALGSKGEPSYSFTGDTNTGMFSDSADTLEFAAGGASMLHVNVDSGKVGVVGNLTVSSNIEDRNIPCLFNSNFQDGTGAGITVVPFNSLSEAAVSTATYYHFLTMPYAGELKRVVLKNVSGSLGSGFTTQLFFYVNGSQQASSSELSIQTDRITWTPTSNNTFSAGDEISFAYQKSAAGTGITWGGVSFGVAIELTDYDI